MKPASAPRTSGFTLVEIMIGLLIGMIGIVVIMQTFSVSEGYKRTSTSGSDAQVNGGLAMYLLQREIRLAGYGLNSLTPMGCTNIVAYNANTGSTFTLRMVPLEINPAGIPAGDPGTDTILITYGSAENFVTGVGADQPSNSSANYTVRNNRDAFQPGDLVIAVQPGAGAGGGPTCLLQEITLVPSASSCGAGGGNGSSELIHNTGQYKNPNKNCQMTTPTYNKPSGITDPATGNPMPALNSANGGTIFDIGPLPQVKVYAIRGGNLTVCDLMTQDCSVAANFSPMVSGIVSLRAVYGKDTDGDGAVNGWDRNALLTAADANSVVATAVEVTAKSGLKEKPSAGSGTCDTTTDAARPDPAQDWFGAGLAAASQIDLSGTAADWQCYRYKLFQTSVPLRNMIWRP
jgi:type IV pilus assembly protein PilW